MTNIGQQDNCGRKPMGQSGEVDLTDKLGQVNLDRTERTRWPV
jgi:hypothetical protein